MKILKILSFMFVMGCAEGNESSLVRDISVQPVFLGTCSRSRELNCWACLYDYKTRLTLICGRKIEGL
jgi:hypothetical protein